MLDNVGWKLDNVLDYVTWGPDNVLVLDNVG